MVEARDTSNSDAEPLRLGSCPACEYPLVALPPAGVCPECGRAYDQRFVVLSGQGRGAYDTLAGGTWRGLVAAGITLGMALMWGAASGPAGYIAYGFMGVCMIGIQLYARVFSPRVPRMQLWLSPDGAAQVASTAEARRAMMPPKWLLWCTSLVFAVGFGALTRYWAMAVSLALVFALVSVILQHYFFAASELPAQTDDGLHGPGVTFRLHPWPAFDDVIMKRLSNGHVRVRMLSNNWRGPVIDVEVALSTAQDELLRQRIPQWRRAAAEATAPAGVAGT